MVLDSGTSPNAYQTQAEISLPNVWAAFAAHSWMIVSVTLLSTVLAAAGSYLMQPIFRAEVLVVPNMDQRPPFGGLAAQFGSFAELTGVGIGLGSDKATSIATLRSRTLTQEFVQDLNLLPVLFENDWDPAAKQWKSRDIPTLWDAYRLFDKNIRAIQEDRRTGLVTLAIEWRDPKAAADWANELVKRANARLQRDSIAKSQQTIAYLELQLEKANAVEVRQALYGLIEIETKEAAVAHARGEFAFKVIDPAVEPHRKVRPKRLAITMLGFSLGLIGSGCLALLLSVWRARNPTTRVS